ncbi:MAG: hypothetical protein ACLPXZ_29940, partial [Mycobacterium sp.]
MSTNAASERTDWGAGGDARAARSEYAACAVSAGRPIARFEASAVHKVPATASFGATLPGDAATFSTVTGTPTTRNAD